MTNKELAKKLNKQQIRWLKEWVAMDSPCRGFKKDVIDRGRLIGTNCPLYFRGDNPCDICRKAFYDYNNYDAYSLGDWCPCNTRLTLSQIKRKIKAVLKHCEED